MENVNGCVEIASGGEEDTSASSTSLDQDWSEHSVELRFASEAIPLREDLFRKAFRYTRNRHDAEDLVQDTYVRAWAHFRSFEPGTNIRAWMARVMVNIWLNTHRRTTRRVQETLTGAWEEQFLQALGTTQSAEDVALQRQPDDVLKQCVATLSTDFQAVVFYADVCEYSMKDIAAMERIPLGTAMSRLHRARRRLRSELVSSGADIVLDVDGDAHGDEAGTSAGPIGVDPTSRPTLERSVVAQQR